jgi:hypothetical protein
VIYLSGAVQPGFSVILTPNMGNQLPPDVLWAADTGCYSQGDKFNLGLYLRWLRARSHAAVRCLFATAPDVVGDAAATWERSAPVLPEIRYLGYKAALCAQDGIVDTDVQWDAFDVLFIGGTTGWKLSSEVEALIANAKSRRKWVHMGRVNSEKRYRMARLSGCDSVDGTYIAFGPDINGPKVRAWTAQEVLALTSHNNEVAN